MSVGTIVGACVGLAGAALALATLSMARYRASSAKVTLCAVLPTAGYLAALLGAALLVLVGVVLCAVLG
jgi:cell division protein FtsX